ncbi:putative aminoglycoside phosphotransferase [Janibacter sp. HTCC2649]|uniref:aminoglycoside phosphotransferase family protein n=1 Tax=Janibacter sp. HTCC2649 TaxID=313589 RepID=UPI000066ECD3|nr:aminoglycoside phosphotransferase family protein [Janibacter sp. HTCC2649]EAP99366.1 putative aminoglycoside phosphotransferase [Janibacter sp. HTCC2649]
MPTLFEGETPVDLDTVGSFVAQQCPQWGHLPLRAMTTSGTEHTTYRLGDELLVRVPRDASSEAGLRKEIDWLPRLRDGVDLEMPVIEHVGAPSLDYPHTWTINRWVSGEDASARVLAGDVPSSWADVLAELVASLRAVDLREFAPHELPQGQRGGHVRCRVEALHGQTDPMSGPLDPTPVMGLMEAALDAGAPAPEPVLLHGDLIPGNLVVRNGRLSGLLDFGTLTTGYAAWDLTPAWWVLDRSGRERFRELLEVDDVSWAWGRAFAASQGLLADWVYAPRGHALAPLGARAVAEALAD